MSSVRFRFPVAATVAVFIWYFAITSSAAQLVPLRNPTQDKNFYLLSLLQRDSPAHAVLASDKDLVEIAAERRDAVAIAQRTCKGDMACAIKSFLWTDEEIHAVSLGLDRLAQDDTAVRELVEDDLRPSQAYILFAKEPSGQLLANAWETCARGLNNIIEIYGEGLPPRYPQIDSMSVDEKSAEFQQQITALITPRSAQENTAQMFFESSLDAAMTLLALNHRDEAGRVEPMENGVNAAAVKAIPTTHWQDYDDSIIVVPGAGSRDYDTPLSDAGRKRCALAAEAFHAGRAPFVLVSGGFVHPSQTRFSEAMEMKKALIADYHVPESAILVDPHARHTTTNMRNAAREMFRYHMPIDKPALVISDAGQTAYIASQAFADRCLQELGYLPYRIVRRDGETALVFTPLIQSLQQDPMDPLDP